MELTPANLLCILLAAGLPILPPVSPARSKAPRIVTHPLEHCELWPENCDWVRGCIELSSPLACGQTRVLVVGQDSAAGLPYEPCTGESMPTEPVFVLEFTLDEPADVDFTATSTFPGSVSLDLISGCYSMECPPGIERDAEGNFMSASLDPGAWILIVRGLEEQRERISVTASCGTVPARNFSWGRLKARYRN